MDLLHPVAALACPAGAEVKILYKKLKRVAIGFPPGEEAAAMATFRGVTGYLRRDLILRFNASDGYTWFYLTDMKEALAVLKGLAAYFNAEFIWKVAYDLERDMTPQLTYDLKTRLCEKCCTEINITDTSSFENTGERYTHKVCPELKADRPP